MMKMRFWITVMLCLGVCYPYATTAQGWRKRMLEQIVALQTHLGYVKKGVGILRDGTKLIGDLRDGEFSLHRVFYDSLLQVNPVIAGNTKARAIPGLYETILSRSGRLLRFAREEPMLTPAELKSVRLLVQDLSGRVEAVMDKFELAITPGKAQLSDDERMAHIEDCYERLVSMRSYQKTLFYNTAMLAHLRAGGLRDTHILKWLHGLED